MRKYPLEKRAEVLADVPTLGIAGAAKKHGVGKATVSGWATTAGIGTVRNEQTAAATEAARLKWEERRAGMVHEIGDAAQLALAKTTVELTAGSPRNAKDFATTMAILVDKAQLLSGGSTQRHDLHSRGEVVADARNEGLRLVGS